MSGLGKVPSFEPDEEAKAMIEAMFAVKKDVVTDDKETFDKEIETIEEELKADAAPGKRRRVRIPEPPEQTLEQREIAAHLAKEEMDIIHDAFMEFSEQTSDTVVYGYLYGEILKLVESFQDMDAMINETIKVEDITKNGQEWYERMLKIRARVLNDVYNKYESEK